MNSKSLGIKAFCVTVADLASWTLFEFKDLRLLEWFRALLERISEPLCMVVGRFLSRAATCFE